jgi:hypothetical protein
LSEEGRGCGDVVGGAGRGAGKFVGGEGCGWGCGDAGSAVKGPRPSPRWSTVNRMRAMCWSLRVEMTLSPWEECEVHPWSFE